MRPAALELYGRGVCGHTETAGERCTSPESTAPPFNNQCLTHWLKGLAGGGGGGWQAAGQAVKPSHQEIRGRTGQKEQGNPLNEPPLVKASSPHCWGTATVEGEQRRRHDAVFGNWTVTLRSAARRQEEVRHKPRGNILL